MFVRMPTRKKERSVYVVVLWLSFVCLAASLKKRAKRVCSVSITLCLPRCLSEERAKRVICTAPATLCLSGCLHKKNERCVCVVVFNVNSLTDPSALFILNAALSGEIGPQSFSILWFLSLKSLLQLIHNQTAIIYKGKVAPYNWSVSGKHQFFGSKGKPLKEQGNDD